MNKEKYDLYMARMKKTIGEPRMDGNHIYIRIGFEQAQELAWRYLQQSKSSAS